MTPYLVTNLAGSYVAVNTHDLVMSTLKVVLLPVIAGLSLNTWLPNVCKAVSSITPLISVILVSLICGSISASNSAIASAIIGPQLIYAILTLHSMGFFIGYLFARILGAGENRSRTIRQDKIHGCYIT